jgi:hypothetical protein
MLKKPREGTLLLCFLGKTFIYIYHSVFYYCSSPIVLERILWARLLKYTGTNCLVQTGFVLVCADRGERNFSVVVIYVNAI